MSTLIHIGFPKCASTYLKRQILTKLPQNLIVPRGELLKSLTASDSDGESLIAEFTKIGITDLKQTVITNEALSGLSFWADDGAYAAADNLYKIAVDPKILIVIREQRDYIKSAYKYSICHGLYLKKFESHFESYEQVITKKLQYHKLIGKYYDLFGKENVLVMPYEMLKIDEAIFFDRISSFYGSSIDASKSATRTKKNRSLRDWTHIERIRKSNLILKYVYRIEMLYRKPRHHGLRRDSKFSCYEFLIQIVAKSCSFWNRKQCAEPLVQSQKFNKAMRESNRCTEKLIGINLSDVGYL